MTDESTRFARIIEMVGDALDRPATERDTMLVDRCGSDTELLDDVRSLLLHHEDDSSAVPTDVVREEMARILGEGIRPRAHPEQIGPYHVIEVLGEGGMGVVYGARQKIPIEREVALKVVRSGGTASALLARFMSERQTLARLDHPNIARVYDAGSTERGEPYLVMEWVRGESVTRYCRAHHLDLDQRLSLVRDICLAVHHAHQRAIIHRDLKPSNVLVSEVDGHPVVKVIDFGIARVLADEGGGITAYTAPGVRLGTLEYMSPEQATWSDTEVDVCSDVYSLGVMLYELLTGELPYPSETLRSASPVEVQRLLRDTDPVTPSQRLAAVGPGRGQTDAAGTGVPPTQLRREVDWVVMQALEKDPDRRYQSAEAMASDITHLLRHEPVTAAPASINYRATKFVRRHRVGVTAGAAVIVALVAGGIAALTGFVQASRARDVAVLEAQNARAVSTFLANMFASVEPDRAHGEVVTVSDVLDSTAARLDRDNPLENAAEVEGTIRFAIGNSYREMSEYKKALPMLRRALVLWQRSLPPDDNRIAEAVSGIGNSHWRLGEFDSAFVYAESLLAFRSRTTTRSDPRYSQAVHILGNAQADLGHATVAESLYRVAVGIDSMVMREAVRDSLGTDLNQFASLQERFDTASDNLSTSLNNLGTVLMDQKRYDEAINVFEQSLAIRRAYRPTGSEDIGSSLANLGYALLRGGDAEGAVEALEQAATLLEQIYGPDHVLTASAWLSLGETYTHLDRFTEAAGMLERARKTYALRIGAQSRRVGQVMFQRGKLFIAEGNRRDGLTDMVDGWKMIQDGLGATHPSTRAAAGEIADELTSRGDSERAAIWRARSGS